MSDSVALTPAPVGRPKLLSRDEIVDAAVALGLEGLTMKHLAAHLNVGAATLYQYFDNRDALMRAAAVRALSEVSLPADDGRHWSAYALDYARAVQTMLAENPAYIRYYQQTDYGFEVLFRLVEQFLRVMRDKGFSPHASMRLYEAVSMAAVAGAIEIAREAAFAARGASLAGEAQRQMEQLGADEVPLFRAAFDVYVAPAATKMETLLLPVFQAIAAERDEASPALANGGGPLKPG